MVAKIKFTKYHKYLHTSPQNQSNKMSSTNNSVVEQPEAQCSQDPSGTGDDINLDEGIVSLPG